MLLGIVDQHAITVDYSPAELRQNSLRCVAQYIACGLDPEAAILLQSHVIGHTDLAWVLGCLTPVGDLLRMTQFKDKTHTAGPTDDNLDSRALHLSLVSEAPTEALVNGGLLFYPC